MQLETSILINRPTAEVWASVSDLGSHTEWMTDAESIAFRTEQRSGIGTTMDVVTKVGPLGTTDVMRITEWIDGVAIGVDHVGAVSGSGRFTLVDLGDRTRFIWSETLTFPWWFGGPLGARLAAPLLRRIWRANLRTLKTQLER